MVRKTHGDKNALAFFFDVDNTLIDNDAAKADLESNIQSLVGSERAAVFWSLYEEVRKRKDFVDLPATLARFSSRFGEERNYTRLADLVLTYPYRSALFPQALAVLEHCKTMGDVAIVSDGDPVFQAAKIARAGLSDAVGGNVFIYIHKEQHLDELRDHFPADRYLLVDDKPGILERSKVKLGRALITVHVKQGRYARAPGATSLHRADFELDAIGDLLR